MMQRIIGSVFLAAALSLAAYAEGVPEAPNQVSEDTDISYAFGMVIGSDLKQTGLTFNYNAFIRGLKESMEDKATRFSMDDAILKVQTAFMAAQAKLAAENQQKELTFLEENRKKPGVTITPSGLQYEVIVEENGQKPVGSDMVRVHYKGSLTDGTVFDSSYSRGEPAEFPLDAVIPGWTEGIQLMSEGSFYRLYVPSKLAYGEQGAGSVIPPYATLIFEVELLAILEDPETALDETALDETAEEAQEDAEEPVEEDTDTEE
ncbi:MAG: FKBP-type peptidyl-prolyl cis-trans isomerase [Treponema sp.]|jgi:FKBP-type peptidyl-prolyl cis-trans isomerase FkpA|nr:FKBP-type peptidyl-prolyl cis-trans isomerase [Treponema sp.]